MAPLCLCLASEVADVHRERLRFWTEVVVPDALIDRRVREHDAGVPGEQLQQIELRLREFDLAVSTPTRRAASSTRSSPKRVRSRHRRSSYDERARTRAKSSSMANGLAR